MQQGEEAGGSPKTAKKPKTEPKTEPKGKPDAAPAAAAASTPAEKWTKQQEQELIKLVDDKKYRKQVCVRGSAMQLQPLPRPAVALASGCLSQRLHHFSLGSSAAVACRGQAQEHCPSPCQLAARRGALVTLSWCCSAEGGRGQQRVLQQAPTALTHSSCPCPSALPPSCSPWRRTRARPQLLLPLLLPVLHG